ncbi:YbaK/EbsC family protein [Haloactinomyces albus]|uniref:Prolyl-tRNA editing enzyme YbaK/EbsC (Cys-tRNA(Pro) deacylase) n=1 Tax=Haloactinomyces albus TaxID=1352928 RepID=A0AAE3ZEB6_9ACTN|nr:YbaK/EbsC family protein [Haloactinomyces albus]MDR7302325.1 prolyl-tRNA editing enzyme YbaK/EbsC (Cys-tRNA(Pro) deacylase) [Haloactinomyces albus]
MVDWSSAAGTLEVSPALERQDLLADRVVPAIRALETPETVGVAEIDPELADTAAFCEQYDSPPELSANCVVVSGKRSGELRYAACLVLSTTRADVNGVVRRRLDVRKASFTPMEEAVSLTGMEYGGITPFGLPDGWPVLVDAAVTESPAVVVGSGLRRSKLIAPGKLLGELPEAEVVTDLGR